jgi:hypothetical protein
VSRSRGKPTAPAAAESRGRVKPTAPAAAESRSRGNPTAPTAAESLGAAATTSAVAPGTGRRPLFLLAVPLIWIVVCSLYGSRQFSFDTLERGYLLEHPGAFLKSWDGSERSQFFFFAHPLELPCAWLLGRALPFLHGHDTMRASGLVASGVALFMLGALVWMVTRSGARSVVAQLALGTCIGFWIIGTVGEERAPALATQLLALWCFWRTLATGRGAAWVAVTLPLAILMHLTGAVLVPFAALVLLLPRRPPATPRRALAIAVASGAAVALSALVLIAVCTTHVRSVGSFLSYATFYHRVSGNNFFELSGVHDPEPRLQRTFFGITGFFAGFQWSRLLVLSWLGATIAIGAIARRPASASSIESPPPLSIGTALLHCAILAGLWTAHFLFYEPQHYDSWTLLATSLLLAAALLARPLLGYFIFALLPAMLVAVNIPHYRFQHQPLTLEASLRNLRAVSRPQDILLVVGGRQGGLPIRGSMWTRFFLAREHERTIVSLYDVLHLSQREYWPRPFRSPEELQAALDSGRRCFSPPYLDKDFEELRGARIADIDWVPCGEVLEVTAIRRGARFVEETLPDAEVH